MDTTKQQERWRKAHEYVKYGDQHPGCHTGAGGFGYVPSHTEADKRIDEYWRRQERRRLVQVLAARQRQCK